MKPIYSILMILFLAILAGGCKSDNDDFLIEETKPISISDIKKIPFGINILDVEKILGQSERTAAANIGFYPGSDNKDGYLVCYWTYGEDKKYLLRLIVKCDESKKPDDLIAVWPSKCKGQTMKEAWKNTEKH